jgi:protein involved in polysaccharide export with SLBB domain
MSKAVLGAVLSGGLVFVSMTGTDAADAIPANLRAQFEKFWTEWQSNKPVPIPADLQEQFHRFLIERNVATFLNSHPIVEKKLPPMAESRVSDPPQRLSERDKATEQALIRVAAAGPDFPDVTPEKTVAVRPMVPAKPDCVLPIAATEPPAGTNKYFEIGDKLKLAFLENVQDVEKNKWGNAAGTGLQQHPELSGDYSIQDDGTIAIPVLGSFDIAPLTPKELQNLIDGAFNKALGRTGSVTIVSIERPPIYVLGPVKNPGSYAYSPGMTVLHAVTLAGGFPRQDTTEPWQKIERVRETTKRYSNLEQLSELLAREAVLTAERDHTQPVPPKQLVDIVGQNRAAAMIAVQQDRQSASVAAYNARLQATAEAIMVARQEVDMLSTKSRSIESMDANIAALKKRADGIEQLYHSGALNNNLVIETKSRVVDAERARQDMIIQLAHAKGRIVTLNQDLAKLQADRQSELDTQIMAIDRQVAEASRENTASEGVLGALQVQFSPPVSAISYEIVRQTAKGPVSFVGSGMSTLIPGDLVNVSTTNEGKADPSVTPSQPNNTRPATTPASAGCR